eukprot:TRINITY_DN2215_c1_g1_i3.p1 TRINITY_DN2215_c1_g1~~TRINITY_DN2215_c1_g1_i3.p1  ORF type:complete len:170 (+),score=51.63 TRINITY_DN2215_c1_g1_i3:55-564(+)
MSKVFEDHIFTVQLRPSDQPNSIYMIITNISDRPVCFLRRSIDCKKFDFWINKNDEEETELEDEHDYSFIDDDDNFQDVRLSYFEFIEYIGLMPKISNGSYEELLPGDTYERAVRFDTLKSKKVKCVRIFFKNSIYYLEGTLETADESCFLSDKNNVRSNVTIVDFRKD